MNGEWQLTDGMPLLQLNRGFLYGDGIFNTMAVYKNMIQHISRHTSKMTKAAYALGFVINTKLIRCMVEMAKAQMQQGVLRFYAYADGGFGYGKRSEVINYFLHFQPTELAWTPEPYAVVSYPHPIQADAILHRHKTLAGLPYVLASRYADTKGAQDSLLHNTSGNVASLTSSCIFWGDGNGIFVIPTSDGCHAGTMRGVLYGFLQGRAGVRSLSMNILPRVKWMVGVNSLGPRLVSSLDGRLLNSPPPDVIMAIIQLYPFLRNFTAETIQCIGFAES